MLSRPPFLRLLPRPFRLRPLTIPPTRLYTTNTSKPPPSTPSPPRLPPKAQKEFEDLQKAARDSFFSKTSTSTTTTTTPGVVVEEDMLHPDVRRGAKPEFEGDVNPKTGERGGPKNDPLRYGDWAFNGRVSDF